MTLRVIVLSLLARESVYVPLIGTVQSTIHNDVEHVFTVLLIWTGLRIVRRMICSDGNFRLGRA